MTDQPGLIRSEGSISTQFDEVNAVIRVTGNGAFSPDEVDAFSARFTRMIALMRARCNCVRVLVDRRGCPPDSPETAERLRYHSEHNFRPGDRVAVIVDSSLSKFRLKDMLDDRTHMLFVSANAALTWLKAHD